MISCCSENARRFWKDSSRWNFYAEKFLNEKLNFCSSTMLERCTREDNSTTRPLLFTSRVTLFMKKSKSDISQPKITPPSVLWWRRSPRPLFTNNSVSSWKVRIFLEISVRTHRSAEQRRWADAERAYELGKDSDNVVRLNLEKLNNPEKAFDIARKGRTPASARLIAKFSIKNSDFMTAIEFLLGAKLVDEAFELAQVGIRKLM